MRKCCPPKAPEARRSKKYSKVTKILFGGLPQSNHNPKTSCLTLKVTQKWLFWAKVTFGVTHKFRPRHKPRNSFLMISVCNQVSNRSSYQGEPGRDKKLFPLQFPGPSHPSSGESRFLNMNFLLPLRIRWKIIRHWVPLGSQLGFLTSLQHRHGGRQKMQGPATWQKVCSPHPKNNAALSEQQQKIHGSPPCWELETVPNFKEPPKMIARQNCWFPQERSGSPQPLMTSHMNPNWQCNAWWEFRPRKKKINPPPKTPQTPSQSLDPPPLPGRPPPLWGFSIKNRPPPSPPSTSDSPEQKKKNIRNVHRECINSYLR